VVELFAISGGPKFDGFSGVSLLALVAGFVALGLWFLLFAFRWWRTFPRMPDAGPETTDLRDEPPAIVNLLANRWKVTQTAIPATLVDLAARRVLGIDLVGGDSYVVRIRDGDQTKEKLTDYERQVLDLVKSRATGGSCPAQALDLGEAGQAESWVNRFKKRVVSDARDRGLARNRWELHDFTIIGTGLAIALGLFASSFALSHLAEGTGRNSGGSSSWDGEDWFWVAGAVWIAAMVAVTRTQGLRETTQGKIVCAHWLGVRNYFRNNHAFDHAQAAAVVLWERNLSYGVALGAAHEAAHDIPLAPDDPGEAWSRYGGMWRQVRVEYPSRFGYGESPGHVLLGGLGRVLLWGGLCFLALPFLLSIALDAADTDTSSTPVDAQTFYLALIATIAGVAAIAGVYLFVRFLAGVIRTWRGLSDLNKTVTFEGQVVKVHEGRAAIDDGHKEELDAFAPGKVQAARGATVRVTVTPHLHFLKQLEVLQAPAKTADDAAAADAAAGAVARAIGAPVAAAQLAPLDDTVKAAAGPGFVRNNQLGRADMGPLSGGAVQTFSDGNGSVIAVAAMTAAAGPMSAMVGFMAKRFAASGHGLDAGDGRSFWMRETDLVVRDGQGMTLIHCDLKGRSSQERLAVAQTIAAQIHPAAVAAGAPPPSPVAPGEGPPVSA
jgi:Predicted membrane protein (DUF2207)